MGLIFILISAIAFIIICTAWLRMHPILALGLATLGYGLAAGLGLSGALDALKSGFGGTIGNVGPIIILGAVIGVFLERSGAAMGIANAVLSRVGVKRVPVALGGMGFTISIPVFCDTGFIILSPLNHALARRVGTSLAPGAIALSLGLYATHTMVPPTPGPVAAAAILQADLGRVILIGLPTALICVAVGIIFASLVASKTEIAPDAVGANEVAGDEPQSVPPLLKSILPILIPLLLIVLGSVGSLPSAPLGDGVIAATIGFVGQPIPALIIGVLLALTLPTKLKRDMLSTSGWVGDAIRDCAVIILITGAGGAFGRAIQMSELGPTLGEMLSGASLGIILPLLIAAVIKTAQGSSTVAILTTAAIVTPLLPALGLDDETGRALTVIAIGAGAMAISHLNDSYFWVVTQLSNMDVSTGLRLHSVGTVIQASVAAVCLLILQAVL